MKKVLMLASVSSMIDQFNMENINLLKDLGYEVHVAANFKEGNSSSDTRVDEFKKELIEKKIKFFQVDFFRQIINPLRIYKAYKQIRKLVKKEKYKFIHCHSPIGGVCGRLVGKRTNTPVIYTAHGFHFYKGASIKNWILFYPIELWLSRYTNILITINLEDYHRAKEKLRPKIVKYTPGVGVNTALYNNGKKVKPEEKRHELQLPIDAKVILSVGELNRNKNHEVIIRAIAKLNNPNIYYVICGQGDLNSYLSKLSIQLGVRNRIRFLGFRDDIRDIYHIVDLFILPSLREGLSVALMEAMASELPVVCSAIRGNTDLIDNDKGGYLVPPDSVEKFAIKIDKIMTKPDLRNKFGKYNKNKIKKFDKQNVVKKMKNIYSSIYKC